MGGETESKEKLEKEMVESGHRKLQGRRGVRSRQGKPEHIQRTLHESDGEHHDLSSNIQANKTHIKVDVCPCFSLLGFHSKTITFFSLCNHHKLYSPNKTLKQL